MSVEPPTYAQVGELKRVVAAWSERHGLSESLMAVMLYLCVDLMSFVENVPAADACKILGNILDRWSEREDWQALHGDDA